jgi:hypothetical protein
MNTMNPNEFLNEAIKRYAERLREGNGNGHERASLIPADEYVVSPRNESGGIEQTRFSHTPEMGNGFDALVASGKFPWNTRGHVIRWFCKDGMARIELRNPGLITTELQAMELQNKIMYQMELEDSTYRTLARAQALLRSTLEKHNYAEVVRRGQILIDNAERTAKSASGRRYIEGIRSQIAQLKP